MDGRHGTTQIAKNNARNEKHDGDCKKAKGEMSHTVACGSRLRRNAYRFVSGSAVPRWRR